MNTAVILFSLILIGGGAESMPAPDQPAHFVMKVRATVVEESITIPESDLAVCTVKYGRPGEDSIIRGVLHSAKEHFHRGDGVTVLVTAVTNGQRGMENRQYVSVLVRVYDN